MAKTKTVKSEEELGWKELEVGCAVSQPGNASQYKVGDWRSSRPIWDFDKCVKCGICFLFCPDAAIREKADGYFDAGDYFYCKGCGICSMECPTQAIKMVEETE
jgi:pyruvate ferredoxin oxidoreductase delta subunit